MSRLSAHHRHFTNQVLPTNCSEGNVYFQKLFCDHYMHGTTFPHQQLTNVKCHQKLKYRQQQAVLTGMGMKLFGNNDLSVAMETNPQNLAADSLSNNNNGRPNPCEGTESIMTCKWAQVVYKWQLNRLLSKPSSQSMFYRYGSKHEQTSTQHIQHQVN